MGNQLLKGYTMQGEPTSCVGCEKMWRVYQGVKTSTGQQVTIFAIEKRALNKSEKDELIKFAKKEAMGLTRIRHPGVLAISQTLIQDENILAFSTEPVMGNLSMLLKQKKLSEIVSNEIQLRLNLFPLLDTIMFLHDNVKTVHLSISFDNIYITKEGKWKISGFSNSQIYSEEGLQQLQNFRCYDYSYCAPQIVLQKKFEKKSDVYSIGIFILNLLHVLYGNFEQKPISSASEYQQRHEKQLLNKINNGQIEKIENYRQLKILLKNVFQKNLHQRSTLSEISNSKWLNDKLVLAVRYLDNITNYDQKQQIQFLKGIMGILNHFSNKILTRKVIPKLMDMLKFKHLIPSILFISVEILKDGNILKKSEFLQLIWPYLKKVVQGKQITANSLYLLVDNMSEIEKVVGLEQLSSTIIPLYIKCFDCPTKLKILALHKSDYIISKMDYQFIKAKYLPKIMACMKDSNSQVHKKSLIALKKSIKILDVQTVTSQVLVGLENSRKAGTDPFINAISISIYSHLAKTLPTQVLSSKLIPTILPYLTDPSVSAQDFYNYKSTMFIMLEKIENERKRYWQQNKGDDNNQPVYTEKDFEFEQPKSNETNTQNNRIGNGGYDFLNNYNQNQQKKTPNSQVPTFPTNNQFKIENTNIPTNTNSSFSFEQKNNDPWKNLTPNYPKQQNQLQIPTHTKTNPPTLKGPSGIKKPPKVEQTKVDYSDPWAALDSLVPSDSSVISPTMNTGNYNSSNIINTMGSNQGNTSNLMKYDFNVQSLANNSKITKDNDPWSFGQTTNNSAYNYTHNQSLNFGASNSYNNQQDDPFAGLSMNNSNQLPLNMNAGDINFNNNTNLNMNPYNQNNDPNKNRPKPQDNDFDLI